MGELYEACYNEITKFISSWFNNESIQCPSEWFEAFFQWISQQTNIADCSKEEFCQHAYQQWLDADIVPWKQKVLPDIRGNNVSLELNGTICLQVTCVLDYGKSCYGQLREHDGNINQNMPNNWSAEGNNDNDENILAAFRPTQVSTQTQFAIQEQQKRSHTTAVVLTDGISHIKLIEMALSKKLPTIEEMKHRFKPGMKVKLIGPLTLRGSTVILKPGTFHDCLNTRPIVGVNNCPVKLLGGEVDNLHTIPAQIGLLTELLREKIDLPSDKPLPSWFPGQKFAQSIPINDETGQITNQASDWEDGLIADIDWSSIDCLPTTRALPPVTKSNQIVPMNQEPDKKKHEPPVMADDEDDQFLDFNADLLADEIAEEIAAEERKRCHTETLTTRLNNNEQPMMKIIRNDETLDNKDNNRQSVRTSTPGQSRVIVGSVKNTRNPLLEAFKLAELNNKENHQSSSVRLSSFKAFAEILANARPDDLKKEYIIRGKFISFDKKWDIIDCPKTRAKIWSCSIVVFDNEMSLKVQLDSKLIQDIIKIDPVEGVHMKAIRKDNTKEGLLTRERLLNARDTLAVYLKQLDGQMHFRVDNDENKIILFKHTT